MRFDKTSWQTDTNNDLLTHTSADKLTSGDWILWHIGAGSGRKLSHFKWSSHMWRSHFCDFIKTPTFVQTAFIKVWWNMMKAVCCGVGVLINSRKNENTTSTASLWWKIGYWPSFFLTKQLHKNCLWHLQRCSFFRFLFGWLTHVTFRGRHLSRVSQ